MSASPVYAPHATVRGESLEQYAADFWKGIAAIPVYAPDGTTIINPQFDSPLNPGDTVAANHAFASPNGKVIMLAGTFSGGSINRTVTIPSGTPVFIPLIFTEWSNPDTPDGPDYNAVPGHYTQQKLAGYAVTEANAMTGLGATLDGQPVADVAAHREPSLNFTYTLPAQFSIDQVFFGESVTGPVQAASDGYYLMFKPLTPGQHVLHVAGFVPDLSATPPLLGSTTVDATYTINVVPSGQYESAPHCAGNASPFSSVPIDRGSLDDLLE
jgi:hypothetical protein